MAFFLTLLAVPLLIAAVTFVVTSRLTLKELGLHLAVQAMVAGACAGFVSCAATTDYEVWSGHIAGKQSQRVSCEHSYPCHCRQECSGSGRNRSCSEVCDTCYDHDYDVDWRVWDDAGQSWNIARVDRQGLVEPARFRQVVIGEPSAGVHRYDNYVKAAPGTLFRHQGLVAKYAGQLPEYPQEVYDYYHVNRFVSVGVAAPTQTWNVELEKLNADLGRAKQVNAVVILVKNMPDDYLYALEESWIGGKKNDAALVISVDDTMKPQWAGVLCWTTNELFRVKLRDDVMSLSAATPEAVMPVLRNDIQQQFVRKPMSDFEYLKSSIVPTGTEWAVCIIISLLVGIVLTVFLYNVDVFDEESAWYTHRRARRHRNWMNNC